MKAKLRDIAEPIMMTQLRLAKIIIKIKRAHPVE